MSCHYPRSVIQDINPNTGEITSRWTPAEFYKLTQSDFDTHYNILPAACGHCAGCASDRAQMWTDRMCLELDHSKTAVFVTLTYDDLYVPARYLPDIDGEERLVYCLDKKALQDFQKRIRSTFAHKLIRTFCVGEYGSKHSRPHYHCILFGLDLSDFELLQPWAENEYGQLSYTSPTLSRLWKFGLSCVSPVSSNAFAYVAHYTTKKMKYGYDRNPNMSFEGFPSEFAIMSRRPGIAGFFLEDHPEYLDDPEIQYQYTDPLDPSCNRTIVMPTYLLKKISDLSPDVYAELSARRQEFAIDSMDVKLLHTSLDAPTLLNQEEQLARSRMSELTRNSF